MPQVLEETPPLWLDAVNEITAPGGPFPSAWRWLLAAATSSPAALRAALVTYALMLEAEGLPQLTRKALETRRLIDLRAPDPKADALALAVSSGAVTLVVTNYAATVLYLRDRLVDRSPAWCIRSLAGWRHALLPRKEVLDWFGDRAPAVAPWILISRSPLDMAPLGRVEHTIHYDTWRLSRASAR